MSPLSPLYCIQVKKLTTPQVRVGMSIGHHPQQGQHTPDMRKPDAEISEKDRADAQRRIEGSLAPDRVVNGAADLLPAALQKPPGAY